MDRIAKILLSRYPDNPHEFDSVDFCTFFKFLFSNNNPPLPLQDLEQEHFETLSANAKMGYTIIRVFISSYT